MENYVIYTALWIFMIFSVVGWIADTVSASLDRKGIIDRGFLVGPVCPMYGFLCSGAYLLNIFVCKDVMFVQFVIFSVFSAVSFMIVNMIFRKIFKITFWDFSGTPLSYRYYISFPAVVLWGIGLSVITSFIDELIYKIIVNQLAIKINIMIFIIFFFLLMCDFIFSILVIAGIKKRAKSFENILSRVKSIERKAEKFIIDSTEKSKLSFKLLKFKFYVQDCFFRAVAFIKKIKDKVLYFVSQDSIFTKRIKSAYDNILNSENAEKVYNDVKERKELNIQQYQHIYEDNQPIQKSFAYGLNYCKLFLLFVLGSVIGCIMETCFAIIYEGHFEIRVGLVYGPFIPIYGMGAVLLTVVLSRFYKLSFIKLFVISGIIGAVFEYFCSWFQEKIFGTISWDYSDMPFNIDGRTSLAYAVVWGILGFLWIREIYPTLSRLIEKIPSKIGYVITVSLTIFMIFNIFISWSASIRADERYNNIPPQNEFAIYLDKHFSDEYLSIIYPHSQKVD